MHIVNFYQYQFQSKEDIQLYIDQFIMQATLLGYSINASLIENYSSSYVCYLITLKNNLRKISVKIFIDKHTNILDSIHMMTQVDRGIYYNYVETINFSKFIQFIIEKL